MGDRLEPDFRTIDEVSLIGRMAIYGSQQEASGGIPQQWRAFRLAHPMLAGDSHFYGASPCTSDRKIHYFTGIAHASAAGVVEGERLTLEAGEYAVVRVSDMALLRDTWVWLLESWLPTSRRKEKSAPEFERFASVSESGTLIGPVEIWIPLEPIASN
jgi:AraC family transcriptional regulator